MERGIRAVARRGTLDGALVARGGEFAMEPLFDYIAHRFAEGVNADVTHHLVAESITEHSNGGAVADATCLEVEKSLLVKLADGAAMRAFDIVVVDLEKRAGIDMGFVGE